MPEGKNYIMDAIEDVYNILAKDDVNWDEQFTPEMKRAVYEAQITYWVELEEYEKIEVLQNKLKEL